MYIDIWHLCATGCPVRPRKRRLLGERSSPRLDLVVLLGEKYPRLSPAEPHSLEFISSGCRQQGTLRGPAPAALLARSSRLPVGLAEISRD